MAKILLIYPYVSTRSVRPFGCYFQPGVKPWEVPWEGQNRGLSFLCPLDL